MKMRKMIGALVLALSVGTAVAQNAPAGNLTLTLDDALRIALDNNPTIKIAGLEIERQEYVRKETVGNHLPSLSASSTYSYSAVKQTMNLGGVKMSTGYDNNFINEASLGIPLFIPAIYKTLKLNDEQMRAAVEAVRGSKINLAAEVKKAFFQVLMLEQSLAVLRESEKIAGETVEYTRGMFNNGLAAEYDLLTAEVRYSNIRPMIIQAENSIPVAKMMLKMYLSLPENTEISVAGQLNDFEQTVSSGISALSTDISGNSDLRALEIQEEVLKRQYDVVKTMRMPTVAGFAQAQLYGNGGQDMISFFDMSAPPTHVSKFEWQHPVSLGVKLSVPIFAGRTNIMKQRQVATGIEQVKLQRQYAEEGIRLQVNSAMTNLLTAREQMEANAKTLQQAEKAYSIATTRYKAGTGIILELNNAELQRTQAKLSHSQAIYDYLSAAADYEKVIGKEN